MLKEKNEINVLKTTANINAFFRSVVTKYFKVVNLFLIETKNIVSIKRTVVSANIITIIDSLALLTKDNIERGITIYP